MALEDVRQQQLTQCVIATLFNAALEELKILTFVHVITASACKMVDNRVEATSPLGVDKCNYRSSLVIKMSVRQVQTISGHKLLSTNMTHQSLKLLLVTHNAANCYLRSKSH